MINVTREFIREINNDNRNYLCYVQITLSNGTILNLTNEDLWEGGVTVEDSVSGDSSLDIGSTIINQCTIVINNIDERYNDYDFKDARIVLDVGLVLTATGTEERIHKGRFIVDEQFFGNSVITLTCLDYMSLFEKPYSISSLVYPATLRSMVLDCCSLCGVSLATSSYYFPGYNLSVSTKPDTEGITLRNIISWVAEIAGMNARFNNVGQLEFIWYDFETLSEITKQDAEDYLNDYDLLAESGDYITTEDGYRILVDYAIADKYNIFRHLYTLSLAMDDSVITGVRVLVTDDSDSATIKEYTAGSEGLEIVIQNNKLINKSNAQSIATRIGNQIIGSTYRKATFTHLGNPSEEAGDIAVIFDGKDRMYKVIVSSVTFCSGDKQSTVSAGTTPARNSASRFSEATKAYIAAREVTPDYTDLKEELEQEIEQRISNSPGLYTTIVTGSGGAKTYYLHNKPTKAESDIIWTMTAEAWSVSTNGGQTINAGMTVDGETIVNILAATKISADIIKGGSLDLGGSGNTNGILRVYDAKGSLVGRMNNEGLYAIAGTIGGFDIGDTYIRKTKTSVSDTTNDGVWIGNNGIALGKGTFKVTDDGAITATGGGQIGPFTFATGTNATASLHYGMSSLSDKTHNGIWLGSDGIALGKGAFKVTSSGALTSTSANISGTITASTLTATSGGQIGGCVIDGTSLTMADVTTTNTRTMVIQGGRIYGKDAVGSKIGTLGMYMDSNNGHAMALSLGYSYNYIGFAADSSNTVNSGANLVLGYYRNVSNRSEDFTFSFKPMYITAQYASGMVMCSRSHDYEISAQYYNSNIYFYYNTSQIGWLNTSSSDERLKDGIQSISEETMDKISSVPLRQFYFKKDESKKTHYGAIAQDVKKAIGSSDNSSIVFDLPPEDESSDPYMAIDYVEFLIARIAADERRIEALETRIKGMGVTA